MHKNAPLLPRGRERIVRQIESGQTSEAVAEAAGVCPRTVRKWVSISSGRIARTCRAFRASPQFAALQRAPRADFAAFEKEDIRERKRLEQLAEPQRIPRLQKWRRSERLVHRGYGFMISEREMIPPSENL
jgi:hypothetical protein